MHKLGIGTNEVEIFSKVCSSQNKRKTIDRSLVKYAMKKKVEDAEWAVRQARIKFLKNKTEYNNVIRRNTFIDIEFQSMMKNECNTVRLERKAKNSQNVQFLMNKRQEQLEREREKETDIKGVKFRDIDLQVEVHDKNENVVAYGGVEVSDSMAEVLTLNPKMMTFEKVSLVDMDVEIEKACHKARYQWMNENVNEDDGENGNDNGNENDEADEVNATDTLDLVNKKIDYTKIRATELPYCSRLIPPKPGSIRQETAIETVKEKLSNVVKEYVDKKPLKVGLSLTLIGWKYLV